MHAAAAADTRQKELKVEMRKCIWLRAAVDDGGVERGVAYILAVHRLLREASDEPSVHGLQAIAASWLL